MLSHRRPALAAAFLLLHHLLFTAFPLTSAQTDSPCAELSSALSETSSSAPAALALSCLRSVPLQTETATSQLAGLALFLQFQSDLAYLNSSQPARLYPDTDLLGGLATLQERVEGEEYYTNEYDFQLDVSKVFASAYDGHTVYIPDIVGTFAFIRVAEEGGRFALMSVSEDGVEVPQVYAYRDLFALADTENAGYTPSAITEIDGQPAEEFLNEQAAMSGSLHDPDANYNLLFPNAALSRAGTIFEEFMYFNEADETVLTFENGTEQRLQTRAVLNPNVQIDLSGVTGPEDFFEACCSGTISSMLGGGTGAGGGLSMSSTSQFNARADIDVLLNYENPRPVLRQNPLEKRQADDEQASLFPDPVTSADDSVGVQGYFPESASDLAVLKISSFIAGLDSTALAESGTSQVLEGVAVFQDTIAEFLDAAQEADKTRLIIDLRGNGGGLGYLAHDTFRQLFPNADPYDAGNYRLGDIFNFTGTVLSAAFEGVSVTDLGSEVERSLYAGALPYNYATQLNVDNSSFDSWSDLAGPAEVPSIDDYTEIVRPNLTNPLVTLFPVYPAGRTPAELSRGQVFEADNVVLLLDGGCASACAIFSEFMKSNSVRQVVVGGRARTGPAQGVGGVKGGQLGQFALLGTVAVAAAQTAPLFGISGGLTQNDLANSITALDRALIPAAGSINLRNTIREGDDTVTPLQYVYDASDYRIFYTAAMYADQELLWRKAYEVAFEDGDTVADSTGHPSAQFGTAYSDIQIPDNAASDSSVSMTRSGNGGGSNGSGNGGDGGSGSSGEDGDESEESAASQLRWSAKLVGAAITFTVLIIMV